MLRLEGPLDRPIDLVRRLRAAGLTLRAGHTVVTRLGERGMAMCEIAEGAGIPALAADLGQMNVQVLRRRPANPAVIAEVRARHHLSQREFAQVLGIDVDTLQNWEQGRNRPDPAALRLVLAFDRAPRIIEEVALEPAN